VRSARHRRFSFSFVVVASALLAAATSAVASSGVGSRTAGRPGSKPSYYLALGDSVPMWNGTDSYPYRILAHYQQKLRGLTLDDVAVSGETTTSMLTGGQYQTALRFLRAHRHHVALITIDIGGNDVVFCVRATGIDETCATQARATIKRNLTGMLAGIRAAAPHVPIFGMSYYNPFVGNWLAGGAARTLTLATTPGLLALNHELTQLFGGAKKTADVQGAFKATDFKTMVPSRWGTVPIAVKRACSWLDIACQEGGLEGFGDDPNLTGAGVIASAFIHKISVLAHRG
jgi:lysophospholipase L1-like esterase